jgi:hypothetical protein
VSRLLTRPRAGLSAGYEPPFEDSSGEEWHDDDLVHTYSEYGFVGESGKLTTGVKTLAQHVLGHPSTGETRATGFATSLEALGYSCTVSRFADTDSWFVTYFYAGYLDMARQVAVHEVAQQHGGKWVGSGTFLGEFRWEMRDQ